MDGRGGGGANLEGRRVAMEIDLEAVLAAAGAARAQPLPRFPAIERDLAIVVEEHVSAGALLAAIKEAGQDLLEQSRPFDEARGAQVPGGSKSVPSALTSVGP